MSVRRTIAALAAVCALALLATVSAVASTTTAKTRAHSAVAAKSLANVPVNAKVAGKMYKLTYSVQRFVSRNGKSYAVGTLTGKAGSHMIKTNNVAILASIKKAATPGGAHDAAVSCPVLHLVLGPLNLNLLGLTVHLNQVVLDITAIPGAGNLLGNLLCDVANLLNGTGLPAGSTLTTGQVTGLLNILNSVLGNQGVLGL